VEGKPVLIHMNYAAFRMAKFITVAYLHHIILEQDTLSEKYYKASISVVLAALKLCIYSLA